MRMAFLALSVTIGLGCILPPKAEAVGCLSGGAAGALAGHMAGHGILGALGGCVAGHAWNKHQKLKKADLANQQSYDQRQRSYDSNYRSPYSQ